MAKNTSNFLPFLLVCGLLAAGVLLGPWVERGGAPGVGQPLPPMAVAGWLNTDAAPNLEGKIVVMDAWASWCGPCLQSMPGLAKLHQRWGADPRVQFIGITPEDASSLTEIEAVINHVDGFNWPVGYGGEPIFSMLEISGIPTLTVFDQSGVSVWTGHDLRGLEAQLESML